MWAELVAQKTARRIEGPLLTLARNVEVGLNEAVEVYGHDGRSRLGRIAALDTEAIIVEVLESTTGLSLGDVRVRFAGEPLRFALGPGLAGRIFDGIGRPIDGGPPVAAEAFPRIDGMPMNPAPNMLAGL